MPLPLVPKGRPVAGVARAKASHRQSEQHCQRSRPAVAAARAKASHRQSALHPQECLQAAVVEQAKANRQQLPSALCLHGYRQWY